MPRGEPDDARNQEWLVHHRAHERRLQVRHRSLEDVVGISSFERSCGHRQWKSMRHRSIAAGATLQNGYGM
jgi:hypothetical protein